jgi:hypothetical protein
MSNAEILTALVKLETDLCNAKVEILKRSENEYNDSIRNAGFELNSTVTDLSNLIDKLEHETGIKHKRI